MNNSIEQYVNIVTVILTFYYIMKDRAGELRKGGRF